MYEPAYYRNQASHARRLARGAVPSETADALEQAAQDFDEIAEDLETGAIKISHPENCDAEGRAAGYGYIAWAST